MRVARAGTRMASRRPLSAVAAAAAQPQALLEPHPNFVGDRSLPRDSAKNGLFWPSAYLAEEYRDYPDGMNSYAQPVILYFQDIQDRFDALTELIETKDAKLLDTKWYELFPSLLRATRGIERFYELSWHMEGLKFDAGSVQGRHLAKQRKVAADCSKGRAYVRALWPGTDLRIRKTGATALANLDVDEKARAQLQKDLAAFIESEDGIAKLKQQKEKVAVKIKDYLKNTPTVLTQEQIDDLLAMSPEQQSAWLWLEYGFNLKQRAAADGVSTTEYIKSLGLSDAKTLNTYLEEIEDERKHILLYKYNVPAVEADKAIQEHLDSPKAKEAIAKIHAGDYTSEKEAAKLLDDAIGFPKQKISEVMLKILREVPTSTGIDDMEKDQIRQDYFTPEYGQKLSDPLGLHKFYVNNTTTNDPYRYLRFGLIFYGLSMCTVLYFAGPEHNHYVHENHELPGTRSAQFWKDQTNQTHL